jgi:hypothetical protein
MTCAEDSQEWGSDVSVGDAVKARQFPESAGDEHGWYIIATAAPPLFCDRRTLETAETAHVCRSTNNLRGRKKGSKGKFWLRSGLVSASALLIAVVVGQAKRIRTSDSKIKTWEESSTRPSPIVSRRDASFGSRLDTPEARRRRYMYLEQCVTGGIDRNFSEACNIAL